MSNYTHRVKVKGSDKTPLEGAIPVGPVPHDERFEVTVRVRRRATLHNMGAEGVQDDVLPGQRHYLTREQYEEDGGADPADLDKVEEFAREHDLVVTHKSVPRRSVFLSGTAAQFAEAFGTEIEQYEHDGGTYRGRKGCLTVPEELGDVVEGVFGIDNRQAARPHLQGHVATPAAGGVGAQLRSFTPTQLARLYNFPTGLDGTGQCIAIIELGGGFRLDDIRTYFTRLGLPIPKVKAVRVDGGNNTPTIHGSADDEVMLDIEVAAAIAPMATIAVYFAPNTAQGFLDAITAAIHDRTNKPSVISISWGSPEKKWTDQAKTSFDQAFQTAAALGITVCCASGDRGSADGVTDGRQHVDFPASSPFVLACGGTRLNATADAISSEVVWNEASNSATGGGISDFFEVPPYQNTTGIPPSVNPGGRRGRGVPDVAANADRETGYAIRVDGQDLTIGGTSAVAPLWAGLIALYNQSLGSQVGFLNPLIYGSLRGRAGFRDITSGNNGSYSARAGWDACTGWGSPNGTMLLTALGG